MNTLATRMPDAAAHPVDVHVEPALGPRNRLTSAFRIILAIPHLLLVGGPIAATPSWTWRAEAGLTPDWGAGGGVLGVVAAVAAMIAWFSILFTGQYPEGLRSLATLYLRWRVRAVAYTALLRDEYPPFGDGDYPASLELTESDAPRDKLTVGFRLLLAIPHLLVLWVIGLAWALTTVIAWFAILFTGRYPEGLYHFGVGALRWNARVEAYLLLLHDEYPPFSLE
jgi:hypothetical protein